MNQKDKLKNQQLIDETDYLSNAASATDCTGLIPSAPLSKAELESYEAVYHYQPPHLTDDDKRADKDSGHPLRKSDFVDRF